MQSLLIGAGLGAAVTAAAALAGTTQVAPTATTTPARAQVSVTITAQGVDLSGVVRSTRPARCAADRTVKLYKLVNGQPHLWVSDTTDLVAGRYVWSAGNTGQPGRFFAKVAPQPGCRGDVSPTIRVRRDA